MRCVSCGEDIPPKWVAVIEKNVCPSCDGPIMTDDAIRLKTELADALARMPNDPQGITGWLLSNYRVQKIGDAEPVERFNRPGVAPVSQQSEGNIQYNSPQLKEFKIASSPYEEFLSRTDMRNKVHETNAIVRSKQDRMAQMAANIASFNYDEEELTENHVATAESDREDYMALQAMLAQVSDGASHAMSGGGRGGALSPEQIMGMQKTASFNQDLANMDADGVARSNVGYNDGELSIEEQMLIKQTGAVGHKVVHNNRLKRIKAQGAIESGAGSFTRSG